MKQKISKITAMNGMTGGKTMTSRDILFSAGHNDECYTPAYAVFPILKYIPKGFSK